MWVSMCPWARGEAVLMIKIHLLVLNYTYIFTQIHMVMLQYKFYFNYILKKNPLFTSLALFFFILQVHVIISYYSLINWIASTPPPPFWLYFTTKHYIIVIWLCKSVITFCNCKYHNTDNMSALPIAFRQRGFKFHESGQKRHIL